MIHRGGRFGPSERRQSSVLVDHGRGLVRNRIPTPAA
jgi:hypothetical protein